MCFQDLFHFNPPELLSFTDWVLDLPRPELPPPTVRLSDARRQHLKSREQQLIHFIKTRLPRTDILYTFKAEDKRRKKSHDQHVVTQLYALYEVEHWPLAKQHVQWTMFMIASLRYDEQVKLDGSEDGLVLPCLPSAATPMYQEMTLAVQARSVRRALKNIKPSQQFERSCDSRPISCTSNQPRLDAMQQEQSPNCLPTQDVHIESQHRSREKVSGHQLTVATVQGHNLHQTITARRLQQKPRSAIPKRLQSPRVVIPSPLRTQVDVAEDACATSVDMSPSAPVPSPQSAAETGPQSCPDELLYLQACKGFFTPPFRDWILEHTEFYRTAMEGHLYWATKSVRRQHQTFVRWVFSHPESRGWSYDDCFNMARDQMHRKADMAFHEWRRHCPDIAFENNYPFRNWLEKMFAYLLATVQNLDPIPAGATVAFARELHAKHRLAAASRQQQILLKWATSMSAQLESRKKTIGALRFRLEATHGVVIDAWTGGVKDMGAFVESISRRAVRTNEATVEPPQDVV